MLSCKDITRLVSESFERKLSLGERINLWMHVEGADGKDFAFFNDGL